MTKNSKANKLQPHTHEINFTFKVLAAIGIIIIVSGHCYHGGLPLFYEWFPPYSFNLALFVFISGYFYNSTHEEHVIKYIWGRTKRLIIPAYLWNIAYGLLILFLGTFGYTIAQGEVTLYNLFIMPFVDGEAFVFNLGSWFVYPLFCVYVFNILFRRLLKLFHCDNEYIILAVYLSIGIFGIQYCIDHPYPKGIMLLLFRTTFFLPCFQFGRIYRAKLENYDKLNSVAYFAIIFAVQLILLTQFESLEYTPSKCTKFSNGCIVPYITAITGIAFWLRVSKLIAPVIKSKKSKKLVRLISDNTYSIMIHHMFGFMVVKWVFYLISCITPLFADFNVLSMKQNIWYFYIPNGLKQYCILYLAGGIFVSVLIGTVTHKVYEILKEKSIKLLRKIIIKRLP